MKEPLYPDNAILLAPLSGFTDLPFRRVARRFGCVHAFTEMVDVSALAYGHKGTRMMLARGEEESFLGVQLVGSNPVNTEKAAAILNDFDFDVLDINMGCPVPKVVKNSAGAALSRDIDSAVRLFDTVKKVSRFPVTAKIRIADRTDPEPTLKLVRALAASGAAAVTVHGRVREDFYSGAVACGIISECAAAVDIPVIANGGVMDRASYEDLRVRSGCSRVMVARGAMGNPWLFSELMSQGVFTPPSQSELIEVMREHVTGLAAIYGEDAGMKIARKIIHCYLKGRGFSGTLRNKASMVSSISDFERFCADLGAARSALM